MIPIRKRSDLESALTQPRALLFLWVNWSVHARNSHRVVERVLTAWQERHPDLPIPYYVADVSEQCGEVWDALHVAHSG